MDVTEAVIRQDLELGQQSFFSSKVQQKWIFEYGRCMKQEDTRAKETKTLFNNDSRSSATRQLW